jgi:hypothetical protein
MENVLEEAIEALRNLPEDRQVRAARAVIDFAQGEAETSVE